MNFEAIILGMFALLGYVGCYVQVKNKAYKYSHMAWFPILACLMCGLILTYFVIKNL